MDKGYGVYFNFLGFHLLLKGSQPDQIKNRLCIIDSKILIINWHPVSVMKQTKDAPQTNKIKPIVVTKIQLVHFKGR